MRSGPGSRKIPADSARPFARTRVRSGPGLAVQWPQGGRDKRVQVCTWAGDPGQRAAQVALLARIAGTHAYQHDSRTSAFSQIQASGQARGIAMTVFTPLAVRTRPAGAGPVPLAIAPGMSCRTLPPGVRCRGARARFHRSGSGPSGRLAGTAAAPPGPAGRGGSRSRWPPVPLADRHRSCHGTPAKGNSGCVGLAIRRTSDGRFHTRPQTLDSISQTIIGIAARRCCSDA